MYERISDPPQSPSVEDRGGSPEGGSESSSVEQPLGEAAVAVMERRPGASGTTVEGDDFEHGVKSRGKTRRGAGYTRGVKGSSGIPRPAVAPR